MTPDGLPLPAWLAGLDSDPPPPPDGPLLAGLELSGFDLPDPAADGGPPPGAGSVSDTIRIRPAALTPPPVSPPAPRAVPAPAAGWTVTRRAAPALPGGADDERVFRFEAGNPDPTEPRHVRVEFRLPRDARGVRAGPAPRRTGNGLEWDFGVLPPGAARAVTVRVPLTPATEGFRHAPGSVAVATRPAAPARLDLTATAPAVAPAGFPVRLTVALANAGAAASPAGRAAVSAGGAVVAEAAVPAVPAGGAHALEFALPPGPPGVARWGVVVTAGDLPAAHAAVEVVVAAPDLHLGLDAPAAIDTDDAADVTLVVENRGAVPAPAGVAALTLPDEFLYRGATAGGALAVTGDAVEWAVPELPAAGRWEASVRLEGFAPGCGRLLARVGDATASAAVACGVRRTAGGGTLAELLGTFAAPAPAADDTDDAAPAAPRAAGERHLLFAAAGSRFAVPIGNVREVLRPLPITPVPGTPGWVAGVANVRGDVVLTIDLANFLGLDPTRGPRGLVIIRSDADPAVLGLLVGDVAGIRPLAHAPPDLPTDPRLARFLTGLGVDAAGVVHRLAAADLLAAAEADAAAAVA